jgi:hypothetical protein
MAKINSPGTLFNLLRKAKTTYQKQAPDPKAEAETRHRKIVEDLKVLRGFARKEESGADLEQPFEMRKLALYKRLKKHYQLLKKERDKDDNKAQLPRYLKTVGTLTLAVHALHYHTLEEGEDENANPDALEEVDLSLLDTEETEGEEAPPATAPTETAAALPKVSNVALQGARLAWDSARKKVHAELQKLRAKILEVFAAEPDLPEVAKAVPRLDGILERLDETLLDRLDEALNASGAERDELHQEAASLVKQYMVYLNTDPLVTRVDDNPFVPVAVRSTLVTAMTFLNKKLAP